MERQGRAVGVRHCPHCGAPLRKPGILSTFGALRELPEYCAVHPRGLERLPLARYAWPERQSEPVPERGSAFGCPRGFAATGWQGDERPRTFC